MSHLYSYGHPKYRAQQWAIRQGREARKARLKELTGREKEVKRLLLRAAAQPLQAVTLKTTPRRKGKPWNRVLSAGALRRWGLTEADAHQLLEAQGYACPICEEGFTKLPVIDHCHATGRRRAFLCGLCNSMLGMARDVVATLRRGADYLEAHTGASAAPVLPSFLTA